MYSKVVQIYICVCVCVCVLVTQSCPSICDPMDCSLPGSSVHWILQARILEWVTIPFSRGSSQSRDWTQVSCITGRFFTNWAIREDHVCVCVCVCVCVYELWFIPLRFITGYWIQFLMLYSRILLFILYIVVLYICKVLYIYINFYIYIYIYI